MTWTVDGEKKDELVHIDLYDCGDDRSCSGDASTTVGSGSGSGGACGAGEFVLGLCPDEGCDSDGGGASIAVPEVGDAYC